MIKKWKRGKGIILFLFSLELNLDALKLVCQSVGI